MSIDSDDFLVMAQSSMDNLDNEAGYRNTISRAYYSAYHMALSCITEKVIPSYNGKGSKLVKGGVHAKFFHYLSNDADKDYAYPKEKLELISVKLKMAHQFRVQADYRLNRNITKNDAMQAFISATELVKFISDMKTESASKGQVAK